METEAIILIILLILLYILFPIWIIIKSKKEEEKYRNYVPEFWRIEKWYLLDKTKTLIYLIQQLGRTDLEATISTLNRELNILNKKCKDVDKDALVEEKQ